MRKEIYFIFLGIFIILLSSFISAECLECSVCGVSGTTNKTCHLNQCVVIGDVNQDGAFNNADINAFTACLTSVHCNSTQLAAGDLNFDDVFNNQDIASFVKALTNYTGAMKDIAQKCAAKSNVIEGTSGDDIFQVKYGKIYVNNISRGNITGDTLVLYGLDGNDTFTTISNNSQIIYGGNGLDTFWVDSTDLIKDNDTLENNGPTLSPVSSVHVVNEYFQPNASDPTSRPPLDANGQNLVDPTTSATYQNFASKQLFTNGPQYNDIEQGSLGDCYFLAALSSMADSDQHIIKQSIVSLGDGTYVVRYFTGGIANYVRIDADLPVSGSTFLAYAQITQDNELWVALLEKAYAQFGKGKNSYSSIASGTPKLVYQQITNRNSTVAYSSLSDDALASFIASNIQANYAESAPSNTVVIPPIVKSHSHALLNFSLKNSTAGWNVTVYNVWGIDGYNWDNNPNDGLLELNMSFFRQEFAGVYNSIA